MAIVNEATGENLSGGFLICTWKNFGKIINPRRGFTHSGLLENIKRKGFPTVFCGRAFPGSINLYN